MILPRVRMIAATVGAALVLLSAGMVRADALGDAADAVLKAVETGDEAALAAAAAKDSPDPWLVADQLLGRGEDEAATKFAKAKPRKDVEMLPAYVAAHAGKEGDDAARSLRRRTNLLVEQKKWDEALTALGPEPTGDDVIAVALWMLRGLALNGLERRKEAVAPFRTGAEKAERMGWLARASAMFQSAGLASYRNGDRAGAAASWELRAAVERRRGPGPTLSATYDNLTIVYDESNRPKDALDRQQAESDMWTALGDRVKAAKALARVGDHHRKLREFDAARARIDEALRTLESAGDAGALAEALVAHGDLLDDVAQYPAAVAAYRRAIPDLEKSGNSFLLAFAHNAMGHDLRTLGEFDEAIASFERAGAIWLKDGDPEAAVVPGNIATVHFARGDVAKAISLLERSLAASEKTGDQRAIAADLHGLAVVYVGAGRLDESMELYRRAFAIREAAGDAVQAAHTLLNMGVVHMQAEDYAQARPLLEDALGRLEKLGDARGLISAHIAFVYADIETRAFDDAAKHAAAARTLMESSGARDKEGVLRSITALLAERRGDLATAIAGYREEVKIAVELGMADDEVAGLKGIARTELAMGRARDALVSAHAAVSRMGAVVGGLSDTESTGARSLWSELYDVGVSAALAAGDAEELSYFVESGRAGALLEALRARDAVQDAALPQALVAAERTARADQTAAARAHEIALEGKKVADIARTRKTLAEATARRAEVIGRMQREAKAAASVLYPSAAPLAEIRAALGADEALVSFVVANGKASALVARRDGARIVTLGDAQPIADAAAALSLDDAAVDPTAALAAMRKLALDPLAFGSEVKRLLVSPDGPLAFVPFAALGGDREVAYVASGTTLTVLAAERGSKGEGVLALGDPVYGTSPSPGLVALHRGAGKLLPLPGTRDEANAVGTSVLLGADATESRFAKELTTSKRWRAVHLACHGLVNFEQPMQSSLAVTKSDEDDGFLTAIEVFRMKVPADLVVLSACETGRGREVRGEGLVGLTRAFMFAGAPRVVVSLWKVDDQATRALMDRFHAAWRKGAPAAAALKEAQAWVRAQEKWKHPAYWAAWVLWGLPE